MIVKIIYGKTIPAGSQGNRGDFLTHPCSYLEREGSDRIRVCMFHLNNTIAEARVALAHESHECLGAMFADCLRCQVDLVGGDPNYRATQRKQESVDIRGGSMCQSLLDCYLEAWTESPACPYLCYPPTVCVCSSNMRTYWEADRAIGARSPTGTRFRGLIL